MDVKSGKKSSKKVKGAQKPVKKKRGILKVAILFFFVALTGAFLFVSLHFNLFAAREKFVQMVYTLDPTFKPIEVVREEQNKREAELKERAKELDIRERELDAEEKRLEGVKLALDDREYQIFLDQQEAIPIYRQPLNEAELAEMTALSKIYSSMDPSEAANILASLYSVEDMAAILKYMSNKSASAVLAMMDVDLAAAITDKLLYY